MITEDIKGIQFVQEAFQLYGKFPVFFLGEDEKPKPSGEQYYTSVIGTPVWDRIELLNVDPDAQGKTLNYINEEGIVRVMPYYTFPDAVLIEATRAKDYIETKIAGAAGTVKEELSLDDYDITIKGVIINNENDDYPTKAVEELMAVFERPLECGVQSKYLNRILKVQHLYFTNIELKQLEGYGSVQPFVLTAKSDNPIVFDLKKL